MILAKELLERAKHTTDCLDWLDVCESECCKSFYIKNHKLNLKKAHQIVDPKSFDLLRYLHLHGCYSRGGRGVSVPTSLCTQVGPDVLVKKRCSWLSKGGLCWHNVSKPLVCKSLTAKSAGKHGVYTSRCLFKIQKELINCGEKKEDK